MNRVESIQVLKDEQFDLLVIGGGATGAGIALDAASRGLKTALVEKNDFTEGTSSRSTKMVHGGVRYLEKAVKHLDKEQYSLVKEGLQERGIFLKNAPHLARPLSFVTPLYKWIDVPQVFIGLKLYDLLSGKMHIGHSQFLSKKEVLRRFPMVNEQNLKAGVLYYDGQFNDTRMGVSIVKTAVDEGAVVANYVEVIGLTKEDNRITGASVKDSQTGEEWTIRATAVVNAAGTFVDTIRQMDDENVKDLLKVSSGIHIVLDAKFAPPETGMMIPETEDGRVLFVIPWEGHAVIGTTDEPATVEDHPKVMEDDIAYVIRHVNRYFDIGVTRDDVKSYWSGLRPLVFDPEKESTEELARNHVILTDPSGLITITGGKWTSYRRMAEEAVDRVIRETGFDHAADCKTKTLPIIGGETYTPDGYLELMESYGLGETTARHLHRFYGDQAAEVAMLTQMGYADWLEPNHPYIEAEVIYTVREEMAVHAVDVLIRRLPLGLLDFAAVKAAADKVIALMAEELVWSEADMVAEKELLNQRIDGAI